MKKPKAAANPIPNAHCIGVRALLCLRLAAPVALWLSAAIVHANPFDFPPSSFNIMDANGTQMIGRAHYEVRSEGNGYVTAIGEDRFNDGEYDIERDELEIDGDEQVPRMVAFEHTFFNANGAVQRANKANFQTGLASCIQYEDGRPRALSGVLNFPPDTFAGAAIVIALQGYLAAGNQSGIVLHDFSCIPGPEIIAVRAYPQSPSEWAHFPGRVVQVEIKPDFAWLDLLVALFVPAIRAWFSPSDNWRFVGGRFTRFYKGPEILLVLASNTAHKQSDPNW